MRYILVNHDQVTEYSNDLDFADAIFEVIRRQPCTVVQYNYDQSNKVVKVKTV